MRCRPCKKGFFKNTTGKNACVLCPLRYYCPEQGMSTYIKHKCQCGSYSSQGASSCIYSKPGFYTPVTNGLYINETMCEGNTYTNTQGKCNCANCPINSTVNASHTDCSCSEKYYGNLLGCTLCPCGNYCKGGGAITGSCNIDNQFSYQGASSCSACAASQFANIDRCGCTNCSDKYGAACYICDAYNCKGCICGYKLANGACAICSEGRFSQAGATSCTKCPSGTYSSAQGACSCAVCPIGYYTNAQTGATTCKNCQEKWGSACSTCTKDECTSCKTGWTLINGHKYCCRQPKNQSDCAKYYKNGNSNLTLFYNSACLDTENRGQTLNGSSEDGITLKLVSPNSKCTPSASQACCWHDDINRTSGGYGFCTTLSTNTTSGPYTYYTCNGAKKPNPYSGCTRTLCTNNTATVICKSNKNMRKITAEEFNALFNAGYQKGKLCDKASDTNCAAKCTDASPNCKGAAGDLCSASTVFLNSGRKAVNNGTIINGTSGNIAGSIRCAKTYFCQGEDLGLSEE